MNGNLVFAAFVFVVVPVTFGVGLTMLLAGAMGVWFWGALGLLVPSGGFLAWLTVDTLLEADRAATQCRHYMASNRKTVCVDNTEKNNDKDI